MSQSATEHRAQSPDVVRCAVITVSDSRSRENDTGGDIIVDLLTTARQQVLRREIIPDDPRQMTSLLTALESTVDAILLTGGTGITQRDQTYETVAALLTKPLPGYGELFRMLSYQQIGPAAMLSRAVGGLMHQTVVLTMPGSPAAVRLAMDEIILPELRHLVREAQR